MKFDVSIFPNDLNDVTALAQRIEELGYNALWTSEAAHNPFLPLTLAALHTKRIELGTAIAVAFPRSPMVTAQVAWDLAAQSRGRFILGLGTQVKAHITKRFSTEWSAPAPRMREYIDSVRAIWKTWQTGAPLRYEGEHYKFTLMTPFFNPGPIEHPNIPIYIAAVGEVMSRLAGEVCDGLHVHPFHTAKYLRDVVIPNVAEGAAKAGRQRSDVQLNCSVFVVTGRNDEERQQTTIAAKSQIAFYASTPTYEPVLEAHGWQDIAAKLTLMSKNGQWTDMWQEISDEMLQEFAIIAPIEDVAEAVKARYNGLLDRVGYYFPFKPEEVEKQALWESAAKAFAH
jgi:probable F420-dependent oxidoreductase